MGRFLGIYRPEDYLSVRVNPSGVVMVKAEALPPVAPIPVGRLQPTQFGPLVRTGVTGRSEQLPVPTFVLRRTDAGGVPFEVVVVGQAPIRGLRGRIVRRVPARKRARQDD